MPNSPQDGIVNLRGRWIYLTELQKHWPEVLEFLMREVYPAYEPLRDPVPHIFNPGTDYWSDFCQEERNQDVVGKLKYWAKHFSITDDWIMDAALQTLARNAVVNRFQPGFLEWVYEWQYLPRSTEVVMPPFMPTLDGATWIPEEVAGPEPWEKFRGRMRSQFSKQLTRYRNEANKRLGVDRPNAVHEAEWTVRYQKTETAIDIAAVLQTHGYKDAEQAMYRRIVRFAKSIGLTLPKHRRSTKE